MADVGLRGASFDDERLVLLKCSLKEYFDLRVS